MANAPAVMSALHHATLLVLAKWNATLASDARVRNVRGLDYWSLLVVLLVGWAIALWHPWIDWFGRPR